MIPRYETPEIKKIWTDQNRFGRWLDVELAATRAWHEEGVVPDEDYKNIVEKAGFSVERIHEIEEVTQHDVIAFVSSVAETIGESGRFVHLGLTSSDVIDTASDALRGPHPRRTRRADHLRPQAAQPLLRDRPRHRAPQADEERNDGRQALRRRRHIRQLPAEDRGARLRAPRPHDRPRRTQVVQRDRHARVITDMAIAGGSLERLALEIRHLQRTEVLEALEPFKKGQKGSSAMPHKKNPILCERVCGMSRLLRGYAVPALENIALWHERDISHSSVERVMWPDAFHLLHYMTKKIIQIVSGMAVDTQKMRDNMDITKGLLFSGRVLIELVEHEGISREDAYAIAQSNAMRCWNEKIPLLELLKSDERITNMSAQELESLFDLGYYLKHIDEVFGRFPELCGAGASNTK